MALHRKIDALLWLQPDIAIICECADPETLTKRGVAGLSDDTCIWVGTNRNKGLGVFAFREFRLRRYEPYFPTLKYVLPVQVSGGTAFNLLAVWAQNASAGITRKNQSGPLRRALTKYRDFLTVGSAIVAGDFNDNAIWDKPGWRMNHMTKVRLLRELGLVSAYHELRGEEHGRETTPTLYWRDRRRDGPTYHIDYAFVPLDGIDRVREFSVGSFDGWCGNGLSDHVPIMVDLAREAR